MNKRKKVSHAGLFTVIIFLLFLFPITIALADAPPSTPTAIDLSLSTTSVVLGNDLTVNGTILPSVAGLNPVENASISLTYTSPDGTNLVRTVTSGADGSFSDVFSPNVAGSWSVVANFAGDATYLGSTSFALPFTATDTSGGGIPMSYLLVAVAALVIVVAAVAFFFVRKRR
jgi:hypothetical protein